MKKATGIFIILGALIGITVFGVTLLRIQPSIAQTIDNYRVLLDGNTQSSETETRPLSLLDAWDRVDTYAHAWGSDASLIYLTSADVNDQDSAPRTDGKRRVWQALYTSPAFNKQLNVQIVDGEITSAIEDGVHDPGIAVIYERPKFDSSDALRQVQAALPDFGASVGRGKGYHFVLQTGANGSPVITVVGSSKSSDGNRIPTSVSVDPTNGQVVDLSVLPK